MICAQTVREWLCYQYRFTAAFGREQNKNWLSKTSQKQVTVLNVKQSIALLFMGVFEVKDVFIAGS